MKHSLKMAALAAALLTFATADAEAGKRGGFTPGNCRMIIEVDKVQGQPITWNVTPYYLTPNMSVPVAGGVYNMSEAAVNDFAIRASRRLCYVANDALRLNDACPETDLQIRGDLTGYGNFACPTYQGGNL